MSNSGVTVDDKAFQAAFKRNMTRKRNNVRAGVLGYAEKLVDRMVAHIHPGSGKPYGRLEDHVGILVNRLGSTVKAAYITVGSKFYRAKFLEFGTSKMRARPFARPALLEAERDFRVDPS